MGSPLLPVATFSRHLRPPPRAHHVEPLVPEDDLSHSLPAGAFAFEVGAHVHPADFAMPGFEAGLRPGGVVAGKIRAAGLEGHLAIFNFSFFICRRLADCSDDDGARPVMLEQGGAQQGLDRPPVVNFSI
jgi:hypothetical protein